MKDTSTKKPKGRPKKINSHLVEEVINDLPVEVIIDDEIEIPINENSSELEVSNFIGSFIKMTKSKTALEIGVFKGESSIKIIESLPNGGQYVGIDLGDYRSKEVKDIMNQGGKSIDFILGDSQTELRKLPKNHFDLIFVDGNHTWSYILNEFKIVENLVAKGGAIIYHDSIKIDDVSQLIKYAMQFKYKAVTLNTPDGHGISILQKY